MLTIANYIVVLVIKVNNKRFPERTSLREMLKKDFE